MAARIHRAHDLTFCNFNAEGVMKRKIELCDFLTRHKVDILFLTETHLRTTQNFRIRNMVGYRTDRRGRRGGGTAIFLRDTIPHSVEALPQLNTLEATAVTINTHYGNITLVAGYIRPRDPMDENDMILIFDTFDKIILSGDLNAKYFAWNSRANNPKGQQLYNLEERLQAITYGPVDVTHIPRNPNHRPDVLDITIVKNLRFNPNLVTINDLTSDHNPVIGKLSYAVDPPRPQMKKITNWEQFQTYLSTHTNPTTDVSNVQNIDAAITEFTNQIKQAHRQATVSVEFENRFTEEFSPLIQDLKTLKNRVRKRWTRFRNPEDKRELRRLSRELHRRAVEWRTEMWEDRMEAFLLNDKRDWNLMKSFKNPKPPLTALHGPTGLVFDPLQKSELFAETYERQNTINFEDFNIRYQMIRNVDRQANQIRRLRDDSVPHLTTPAEVRKIIRNLGPSSAPGTDGITNTHLKHLPRKSIVLLTRIYNSCLLNRYFPTDWKISRIVPIPKPEKDPREPVNHRPISLLPTMSKVFERIILTRLRQPLQTNDIIRPDQYAFQTHLSAELQLLRVTEFLAYNMNRAYYTAAIFLDVEKAYDKVWKAKLLTKLHNLGVIPTYITKLIDSFLTNRRFFVRLENQRSGTYSLDEGIPQGSVLSPTLFILYVNDLPTIPRILTAQFADDTVLMAYSRRMNAAVIRLQRQVTLIEKWARDNLIKINADKTQAVMFTRRRPDLRDRIRIHNVNIPWSTQVRYLGVILDNKLTFKPHITRKKEKMVKLIHKLFPLLYSNQMNTQTKLRLYKSTILPAMTYGCSSWGTACPTNIQMLQVLQNKCLRLILKAPRWARIRELHNELHIEPITDFIKFHTRKLLNKIEILRPTTRHLEYTGTVNPARWHRVRVPRAIIEEPN